MKKSKLEQAFDANWETYIVDALSLYITSEGWECNPTQTAKRDYNKLKRNLRHVIENEKV